MIQVIVLKLITFCYYSFTLVVVSIRCSIGVFKAADHGNDRVYPRATLVCCLRFFKTRVAVVLPLDWHLLANLRCLAAFATSFFIFSRAKCSRQLLVKGVFNDAHCREAHLQSEKRLYRLLTAWDCGRFGRVSRLFPFFLLLQLKGGAVIVVVIIYVAVNWVRSLFDGVKATVLVHLFLYNVLCQIGLLLRKNQVTDELVNFTSLALILQSSNDLLMHMLALTLSLGMLVTEIFIQLNCPLLEALWVAKLALFSEDGQ